MLKVDIEAHAGQFQLKVDLTAQSGEVTGVLGATGCGKSMTLRCIAGIQRPDRGRIELDGETLFDSRRGIDLPPQRRRVGYLFQGCALFPRMTVAENIAAGARDRKGRREVARKLMDAFLLAGLADRYPGELSGGQRQQVALARILAGEPCALLLDEPFSALDDYLKWNVELELMDRLERFGGPVVFVTHSRDEVRRHCKSVCVLDGGRSQPTQSVERLFAAPATLGACLLSGCKNYSRAVPAGEGRVLAADWGVELICAAPAPGDMTCVGVRSHDLRLAGGPGPNRLVCTVTRVVDEVFSTVVFLSTPGGSEGWSRLRLECPREALPPLAAGDALWVEIPPQAVLPLTQ